jgi:condensin complex subunit 3
MPGRASTRSTRTSTASTTKSTRASSARQSANAVEIPDDGPLTSLRTQVAQVFGDAQKTTATQRKLVVNLRKIQEVCCYEPPTTNKGGKKGKDEVQEDFDEEEFNTEVGRCVVRILCIKKSEPVGDRLIRFLGLFLKFASEKGKHFSCKYLAKLTRTRQRHLCSERDRRRRGKCFPRNTQQPPHIEDLPLGAWLPQCKR